MERQEEDTLCELRIFLRNVTNRLVTDRRFRAFTKPVDPEEVPNYYAVIKQPMDLSAILSKIDSHQYLTAGDFLQDIDLICSNALEYNPVKDPADRLIRHKACSLKDTAYSIVREEINKDFEQRCEEIKESRKQRGCTPSKYAPSYYHVMPEQNSVPGHEKTDPVCNEKEKMPAAPVDSNTPRSNDMSKRKRRRNRVSSGLAKKRRNFQFNKESKDPEDQNEVESDEESPEQDVCNIDCTEDESTQGSFREANENLLPEGQKNGTEDETFIFVAKYLPEKMIFTFPEHPDLRMESEMPDSPRAESSEDRDSNDAWAHCVAHGTHSQVEEQGIGANEAREIFGQSVVVDYHELKQVLRLVTEVSENFDIFHLEKLYALLSQCIYTHRGDDDQTELVKEMKTEIGAFGYAQ